MGKELCQYNCGRIIRVHYLAVATLAHVHLPARWRKGGAERESKGLLLAARGALDLLSLNALYREILILVHIHTHTCMLRPKRFIYFHLYKFCLTRSKCREATKNRFPHPPEDID
jgi:hypothetical protein